MRGAFTSRAKAVWQASSPAVPALRVACPPHHGSPPRLKTQTPPPFVLPACLSLSIACPVPRRCVLPCVPLPLLLCLLLRSCGPCFRLRQPPCPVIVPPGAPVNCSHHTFAARLELRALYLLCFSSTAPLAALLPQPLLFVYPEYRPRAPRPPSNPTIVNRFHHSHNV